MTPRHCTSARRSAPSLCSHLLTVVIHTQLLTFVDVLRAGFSHIAYAPHRKNPRFHAKGFMKVANKWNGLCSYCNKANQGMALCNIPVNSHSWKKPQQYNPGFMCGRENTYVPSLDLFYIQISWAGGKGCDGDHNSDSESLTGQMCLEAAKNGVATSQKCDTTNTQQMFRMEELPMATFMGKNNTENQIGVYR